jgi:hypothetical protein
MNADGQDLARALCEVRKAYRVLYAYQQRVLDLSSEIANRLDLQFFYSWYYPNVVPRAAKSPLESSAWDFLPLADASVFFSNTGSELYARKGDWMIEYRVISDSAYKDAWENLHIKVAPLDRFSPPDSADSYVLVYGWIRTKSGTGKWMDIHGEVEWPEPGKLLRLDNFGVTAYAKRFDFIDFADQSSTEKALRKLTAELRKKLHLKLSDPR